MRGCTQRGDIEALLRREGIYDSLLTACRKQLALHGSEALAGRKPGRKPKQDAKDRRIAELEKRSARLAPSPRRLSDPERQAALDVLHSDELADQPPPEVTEGYFG